jgi:hypothetical protein
MRKLGRYNLETTQPYDPQAVSQVMVQLPNRSTADAWPDAIPAFQTIAAEECRRATKADHIREFRWSADYPDQNWTLLLLPLYTTYYLDDDRNPQPVLIHGQTGQLSGPRRASMKRAQRAALIIVAVAAPPLLLAAGVGMILAMIIGMLAIAPMVIAWQFNRSQKN